MSKIGKSWQNDNFRTAFAQNMSWMSIKVFGEKDTPIRYEALTRGVLIPKNSKNLIAIWDVFPHDIRRIPR